MSTRLTQPFHLYAFKERGISPLPPSLVTGRDYSAFPNTCLQACSPVFQLAGTGPGLRPSQVVLEGVSRRCGDPASLGSPSEQRVSDGAWEVPLNSQSPRQRGDPPEGPQDPVAPGWLAKMKRENRFPKVRRQDHKVGEHRFIASNGSE